jgi:hypothetical protein
MITYNIEVQLEGDTDKCGNYITVQYEFPFPENSVLIERDKEMNRILTKPIIITTSNNNNCQQ